MNACPSFGKLPVAVRFNAADFGNVILGGGCVFHKVSERAVSMTKQGFRQNQPAL